MRLVDLLLQSPRNPYVTGQETMLTHVSSSICANSLKVNRQVDRSTRSSGSLTDLLNYLPYGHRSPLSQGVPSPTVTSSTLTPELIRLLQQQDSNHLSEPLTPNGHGSPPLVQAPYPPLQRNYEGFPQEDSPQFVAIDKNLNCTTWKGVPPGFRVSSSSLSSSSFSSSPSSVFGDFSQRQVSILSSEGSEPEFEPVLSSLVDSDSYESQTSPVNEIEAVRWADQPSVGYSDWFNMKEAEENEKYDIDIFNFNLFGSSLDGDSAFASLEGNTLSPATEDASLAPVSMPSDIVIKSELVSNPILMEMSSGCHEFKMASKDFHVNGNLIPAHTLSVNGNTKYCNGYSQMDRSSYMLPGYASMNTVPKCEESQSEVVKLLLQNRHQWVPQAEKLPTQEVSQRGSGRKRASAGSKETTKAKAPRSAKLRPSPSERRHSAPTLTKRSSSTIKAAEQEDTSTNLEKLITDLMLLESAQDYQVISEKESVSAAVEHATSIFENLSAGSTSDLELLAHLDLDSLYANECEAMLLLEGRSNLGSNYEEMVKSEPVDVRTSAPLAWLQEYLPHQPTGNCHENSTEQQGKDILYHVGKSDPTFSILEAALKKLPNFPMHPSETASDACDSRKDAAMFDHDYCQTKELSSSSCCRSETSGSNSEKERHGKPVKNSDLGSSINCDYSTLKSLLLDSNLTEEVRKEVEADRAKSRRKMSEKLPLVEESIRVNPYGQVSPADREILLRQFSELNDNAPYKLCQNFEINDEIACKDTSSNSENRQLTSSDDFSIPPNNDQLDPVSSVTTTSIGTMLAIGDHYPNSQTIHETDPGVELSSSDSDLSGDLNAIFFDSFEDFYNQSNNQNLDSKLFSQAEGDSTNNLNADIISSHCKEDISLIGDFLMKNKQKSFPLKSKSLPRVGRGTSRTGRWIWKRRLCLSGNRTSHRLNVSHEKGIIVPMQQSNICQSC